VGFAGVVVGRMIPVLPLSWKEEDTLQVIAEDYWVLPVDSSGLIPPMPSFTGLQLCDHFPAAEARKLFIHNMFHAVLAYHGYSRGISTIAESVADPFIRQEGEACLRESLAGFLHRYHLDATLEREYAAQLVLRMENPYLMDTVLRVGRDPIRKLGPEDRLIGAARLACEAGETPTALARAVCAALRFDSSQDATASELQRRLRQDGVLGILEKVCQLKRDEPLCGLILKSWEGNST
jgi:mannitol-1-phosphate 5-dehydrogenase